MGVQRIGSGLVRWEVNKVTEQGRGMQRPNSGMFTLYEGGHRCV